MAYPVVASSTSSSNAKTTSHTIGLPASISSGDLLLVFFQNEDDTTVTTPSGWTLLTSKLETSGVTNKISIFYKSASGSEGASVTITTSSSRVSTHISYRVTGWSGTPESSTFATSATGNADPSSLTPSGGTQDYLWIAVAGTRNYTLSSYPTNYSSNQLNVNRTGALGGCAVAVATRDLNASSEDPGTFYFSSNNLWVAGTIAIFPVSSGPANLKSYNTNLKANIKTINTNPIANVKSLNTNT